MDEFGGIEVEQEGVGRPTMDIPTAMQKFGNGEFNDYQNSLYNVLVERGSIPQNNPVTTGPSVMPDSMAGSTSARLPMPVSVDEFGGIPVDQAQNEEAPFLPITEDGNKDTAMGRIGDSFSERATKVGEFISRQVESKYDPLFDSFGYQKEENLIKSAITSAPIIGAVAFGQAAGAVGDVAGEIITATGKALTPDEWGEYIKDKLTDLSQTRAGQLGLKALNSGQEAWGSFEDKYPDTAIMMGSMMNVLGLGVGTKGAKMTAKEIVDIGEDITTMVGKTVPVNIERQIAPIVKEGIAKAIRPSVVKGKIASQAKQFYEKANNAVRAIIENKNNLNLTDDAGDIIQGLPSNLKQFSEAISTTKKEIFNKYDEIAQMAGEAGAKVDLSEIVPELDAIINHRGLQATSPDIVKYAADIQERLNEIGSLSAKEAQDSIAALNNRLASVTDFNSAAKASVDSLVANKLRGSLDNIIEETTGMQYGELKRKYGALKEIERDVNRRAMVDARKNTKGLIDFTDVFTGAETVRGILSLSPSATAAGVTGKGIASYIKRLNDPNRIVKNMFEKTEKLIKKGENIKQPFLAKSKTVNIIKGDQ